MLNNSFLGLLIIIMAGFVCAYDFKDPYFNEYLFDELQPDYDEDILDLIRNRRDAPLATKNEQPDCKRREWKKDFNCCSGDKVDAGKIELYSEAKKQCQLEVRANNSENVFDPFDCEKMQQVKEQMICVSECIAKKFNLLDANGDLNRDTILIEMRGKIGDVQWKKDVLEGYVDKCLAELKETSKENPSKGCNRCPLDFQYCIWREFSNGCPADLRTNSTKCNKIRERLAKGDKSALNKHFLHHFQHIHNDE